VDEICRLDGSYEPYITAKARAYLIAAAPDMLRALQRLAQATGEFAIKYRAGFRDVDSEIATLLRMEHEARTVIAQAEPSPLDKP
jgi:hypothetical protein